MRNQENEENQKKISVWQERKFALIPCEIIESREKLKFSLTE